ncbi:MAG: DNA primase, partial [Pseudomonas sp.]|nr:DNA primase [Pseudomonas sp.]
MRESPRNESEFIGHEPCPSCGSSDNLGRYSDGHAHCFSQGCEYWEPPNGEHLSSERPLDLSKPKKDFKPIPGEIRQLKARQITEATCKLWGYRIGKVWHRKLEREVPAQIVDIRDPDTKQLIAQKGRTKDKEFPINGDVSAKPLIGAHLWTGGRRLVITEGEIDAMTVSQLQGNKWPVVSLLNGTKAAKKNLLANLEYLKRFDELVLLFDMDEPGQEAVKECAEVLISVRPTKIAKLPLKDANEMLLAGRGEEVTRAIWNAEEYKPDGILEIDDLIDTALEEPPPGLPWVFPDLNKSSNGRHYSEIHTIGAGTGVGKTDLLLQQADYDVRELGLKVGLFLLENDPAEVLLYLAGKQDGKFYYEPGHAHREDKERLREAMSAYKGRVSIYDNFGLCDWDLIKTRVLYLIAKGYRVFYVDHLTALATGGDKDEKAELEEIMADIAEFAKRHNVLFI